MLNKPVLETTRSAANALALAAQSENNIPNLLTHTEGIVKGVKNLFQFSQDASTLFGCSVLLSKLSVNSDFCIYCADTELISSILQGLVDWSGQGKRDVSSTQILLQLTKTLENIKKNLSPSGWIQFLSRDPESLDLLEPILKEGSELGKRLFSILFNESHPSEENETNSTENIGEN